MELFRTLLLLFLVLCVLKPIPTYGNPNAIGGHLEGAGLCHPLRLRVCDLPRDVKMKLVAHSRIKSGECIKVKGKVSPEATSFSLNLGWDETNLILHFNPRFDFHGDIRTIVCNSKSAGEWGDELRESEFPFHQGEETKICVSFDAEEVTVKLPEGQELKFPNRLRLETAEYFSVAGDLDIKSVKFD